ncbi:MAG: sigma-70 family RNA polymerase sigma factor [Planctomycetales bacterium]|nr:sigma-70 family RNA polymerase sigma factor [Planctomycetales bacterium]
MRSYVDYDHASEFLALPGKNLRRFQAELSLHEKESEMNASSTSESEKDSFESDVNTTVALIMAARNGSSEALGQLLEQYRAYLLVVAHDEMDATFRAKAGPSDMVQETLLEAQRDFQRFQGMRPDDVVRWLRGILQNNIVDVARRFRTARREVGKERPLPVDTGSDVEGELASDTDSPEIKAIAKEDASALQQAIVQLPAHYRLVIQLRHTEGLGWNEIARRTNRSTDAVQKLWVRALLQLRSHLPFE